jgi:vacuole morphology and inheritance protein 14
MLSSCPQVLLQMLPTLSGSKTELRQIVFQTNQKLFELVCDSGDSAESLGFDCIQTVNALMILFQSEENDTRVSALDWLITLNRIFTQVIQPDSQLSQRLLLSLSDISDDVVKGSLQLLAQVHLKPKDTTLLISSLLELFQKDPQLLENRGNLIIRTLCQKIESERIYENFAVILRSFDDHQFISTILQNLNLILLTTPELGMLRKKLKNLQVAVV